MHEGRTGPERLVHRQQWRQFLPRHRKSAEIEILDRRRFAHDERHRFALEARDIDGEDRLVGKGLDDAVAVDARYVGGGQDTR